MSDFLEDIKDKFFEHHHCRCICKSNFDIRVPNALVSVIDPFGVVQGTVSLKGSVCPNCNEDKSSFTLTFKDDVIPPANDSFVFKTCTAVETLCRATAGLLTQSITASGIFDPKVGPKRRATILLTLVETENGDDRFDFSIFDSETGQFLASTGLGAILVPDKQLTIKKCGK